MQLLQAKDGLPKKFHPYMKAYFFLSNHPKFGSVLEANKKSGSKRKGCKYKKVSDATSSVSLDSSQKFPSAIIADHEWPVSRDSAKKAKSTDFVIDKVTEAVTDAVAPSNVGMSSLKTIKDTLNKANDIMQTMTNHQVMAMAPSDIGDQYFSEVFDLINTQARNKRLRLHLENEELALCMEK